MQFELLLFSGLIAAGVMFRKRQVVEGLWILFFAHMALSSVRHVPLYVAACAPAIAANLRDWCRGWTGQAKKNSIPGILNQIAEDASRGFRREQRVAGAGDCGIGADGQPMQWPTDFPAEIFPVKMVHDHRGRDP